MRGKDWTGLKFGRWTFVKKVANIGHHTRWLCRCDCGTEKEVYTDTVSRGKSSSCGCLNAELLSARATHGLRDSPEYAVWNAMLGRCYRPKDQGFKNYGARGVKVCSRWKESFKNFIEDMGRRPNDSLTLERVDNSRGYGLENCIWATRTAQGRNKRNNLRITINGVTKMIPEWSEETGISTFTLYSRHYLYGWPPERLLEPAFRGKNQHSK